MLKKKHPVLIINTIRVICSRRRRGGLNLSHLCQVSPGRGAVAQPGATGTRSSPHDSCTRPRRSRWPRARPRTKSKRIRKSLREGMFLGTLPHLTPGKRFGGGLDSCRLAPNCGTGTGGRDGGFEHLTNVPGPTFTSLSGGESERSRGVFSWESGAGWSLSVPRSALCSGLLSARLFPKPCARPPLPRCLLQLCGPTKTHSTTISQWGQGRF